MGKNFVAAGLNWCTSQTLVGQDQAPDLDLDPDLGAGQSLAPEAGQSLAPEAGHVIGPGPDLDHANIRAVQSRGVDHETVQGQ